VSGGEETKTNFSFTNNNGDKTNKSKSPISWAKSLSNSINFLRKKSIFKSDPQFVLTNETNTGSKECKRNSLDSEYQVAHLTTAVSCPMQIDGNAISGEKIVEAFNSKSPWNILCHIINCKVAFKKQFNGKKYNWIQLAGHAGRFKPGDREGFILKLMDESERDCMEQLSKDALSPFVPRIDALILDKEDKKYYIEMQDLLYGFHNPRIMDIKIGVRTFLENEQDEKETKPRLDLYNKLCEISPSDLTDEEHERKAINKKRYMQWRESSSSSATLGFRIEAIKKNQVSEKEFFMVKERSTVLSHFKNYTDNNKRIMNMYVKRLEELLEKLKESTFFCNHEMIGSSLLFVHDDKRANIWIIDFGKTRRLPPGVIVTHCDEWLNGNHEDGYFIGINSLISIFKEAMSGL
jgi:1D-myo-inositol-triphosphate 3-kinase